MTPLLEVRGLTKHFRPRQGLLRGGQTVRAVEDVSFAIERGTTFALVGESGCGKTTVTRMILGLERPTAGTILFDGLDLTKASRAQMRSFRRRAHAVFQDPYASLNPRLRVRTIITEPLLVHEKRDAAALRRRIAEVLDIVGLPATAADLYPHEFSGGQRQRIAIARALALNPSLIVLDEPVSALDVSIRAQVLNLLSDIQEQLRLTYLIVAHDLALVEHFSLRVGVMYLGGLAEVGPTEQVFTRPSHPYTRALLASVPRPDPDHVIPQGVIFGEVGSALAPPPGCKFHPRCPVAIKPCSVQPPPWSRVGADHRASCHLLEASR